MQLINYDDDDNNNNHDENQVKVFVSLYFDLTIFYRMKISIEHLSFQWGHVRTGGFLYCLAVNSLGS